MRMMMSAIPASHHLTYAPQDQQLPASASFSGDPHYHHHPYHMERKLKKPLMEKRRRARINQCLGELKQLLLHASTPTQRSKLEKADILEMTVQHLRTHATATGGAVHDATITRQAFLEGYSSCAGAVLQYLDTAAASANCSSFQQQHQSVNPPDGHTRLRSGIAALLSTTLADRLHNQPPLPSQPYQQHPLNVSIPAAHARQNLPGLSQLHSATPARSSGTTVPPALFPLSSSSSPLSPYKLSSASSASGTSWVSHSPSASVDDNIGREAGAAALVSDDALSPAFSVDDGEDDEDISVDDDEEEIKGRRQQLFPSSHRSGFHNNHNNHHDDSCGDGSQLSPANSSSSTATVLECRHNRPATSKASGTVGRVGHTDTFDRSATEQDAVNRGRELRRPVVSNNTDFASALWRPW